MYRVRLYEEPWDSDHGAHNRKPIPGLRGFCHDIRIFCCCVYIYEYIKLECRWYLYCSYMHIYMHHAYLTDNLVHAYWIYVVVLVQQQKYRAIIRLKLCDYIYICWRLLTYIGGRYKTPQRSSERDSLPLSCSSVIDYHGRSWRRDIVMWIAGRAVTKHCCLIACTIFMVIMVMLILSFKV